MGLLLFGGSSCDFDNAPTKSSDATDTTQESSAENTINNHLKQAVEKICLGQFDQAEEVLAAEDETEATKQLKQLLAERAQLQISRQQARQEAYQQEWDDLKKIQEEAAEHEVIDVNTIDVAMVAVVRANEYADEDQKAVLMNDPFVVRLLSQMQAKSDEYEQQGKWLDAYAHNYYWLTALDEDNQTYKDKADELTGLASIELSLKDSSCGETAKERFEGIKFSMFERALELLVNNYVNQIDCDEMAIEGLKCGIRLGKVLAQTNEELAWSASPEAVAQWTEGLEAMKVQIEKDVEADQSLDSEELAELFKDVLALSDETIKIQQEVLIAQLTESSFAALDPYTNLIWPWSVRDFEKSMTQQFSGIGVEISKTTGVLTIVSLLPDTPAYRSGLDADDEIVAVDGEPTGEMTTTCAVSKITGPKGTKVQLTIHRPSTGKTWDVSITRDRIVVDPLRGWTRTAEGQWDYVIDPENRIGYIRLTAFTENTGPDLGEVLKQLEKDGLNGLILDLRFNVGGYLQAAADTVDMFVSEGVIVKSTPREGFATYEIAHRKGTHPNYPLVVMINDSSASASEIVAGALQDDNHKRATLVGTRSYGKGSVQVVTNYTGDGSQMKYTIAYYHLPSDQRVKNRYQIEKQGRKDWGIAPDVEVAMSSNELKAMIDIQRDNDILFRDDHEENGGQAKRHSLADTIAADPQVATSLLVVRSKLLMEGSTLVLNETPDDEMQTVSAEKDSSEL